MNVQDYLKKIEKYDIIIRNKMEEVEWIKTKIMSTTISCDKEFTGKTNKLTDKIGEGIAAYHEIMEQIDDFLRLRENIITQIENIDDIFEMEVLYEKYVRRRSVKEIAYDRGYTTSYVFRTIKKAERTFCEKYCIEQI